MAHSTFNRQRGNTHLRSFIPEHRGESLDVRCCERRALPSRADQQQCNDTTAPLLTSILRYSGAVQKKVGQWREVSHLSSMYIAFCGENAFVSRTHRCEVIADEIWFLISIGMREDVSDCSQVRRQQSRASKEALVCVSGSIGGLPVVEEPCVLLVVHLAQVSQHKRRTGRAAKMS